MEKELFFEVEKALDRIDALAEQRDSQRPTMMPPTPDTETSFYLPKATMCLVGVNDKPEAVQTQYRPLAVASSLDDTLNLLHKTLTVTRSWQARSTKKSKLINMNAKLSLAMEILTHVREEMNVKAEQKAGE